MYDKCHPVFAKMGELGCRNGVKHTAAFQIYMELCEVKRFWDVQYKYNKPLDLIYLEARTTRSSLLQKYIPWPAMEAISLSHIELMQKELETDRLTLVFLEGDTTSIYYCVSAGLVKPASPEQSKELKQKEEKKLELDNEIKRNASHLYELAVSVKTKDNPDDLESYFGD